jgi:hypothetical protein
MLYREQVVFVFSMERVVGFPLPGSPGEGPETGGGVGRNRPVSGEVNNTSSLAIDIPPIMFIYLLKQ